MRITPDNSNHYARVINRRHSQCKGIGNVSNECFICVALWHACIPQDIPRAGEGIMGMIISVALALYLYSVDQ